MSCLPGENKRGVAMATLDSEESIMKSVLIVLLFTFAECATAGGYDSRPQYPDSDYGNQDRESGYRNQHREPGRRDQGGPPAIRIDSATYGYGRRICDATFAVRGYCEDKTSCSFGVSNHMCGDPAPGRHKDVMVEYGCRGSGAVRHANIPENETAYLRCE